MWDLKILGQKMPQAQQQILAAKWQRIQDFYIWNIISYKIPNLGIFLLFSSENDAFKSIMLWNAFWVVTG